MSELTEYEKQRLAQIAKNKELLQSLQIDRDSRRSRDGTPEGKPKSQKPAAPRRRAPPAPIEPLRVSTRSRTVRTAALASVDPEAAKRKREEEELEEQKAEAARKQAKHATREIECWNPSGRFVIEEAALPLRETLQSIAGSGSWKRQLHAAIKPEANGTTKVSPTTPVTTSKRAPSSRNGGSASNGNRSRTTQRSVKKEESDSDVDYDMSSHVEIGIKSLRKTFEKMSMREVKKITPDRVYSLAVHPTTDKDLVFVGDRKGWLGIWNASADDPSNAADDEDEENNEKDQLDRNAFVQRVYNDHGTISCTKLDPIKAHTVYTSSYDCTMRSLNFEVGIWSEMVDVDRLAKNLEGEGEALISAFEITHDGNEVWLSDNRGGVTHADLRESPKSHKRWKVAESKVGCISVNPANENIFATSHLLRDVRIWDARYLKSMNPKTTIWQDALEEACLAQYTHGKAVSAAYFDPSGRHLASTCYDDRIRIWNVNPHQMTQKSLGKFAPAESFYHDNNTGAYTSVFKATWSSNPIVEPYLTVGNMSRTLDIYSKSGDLITKLEIGLSSVPAVTCGHPSQPALFAGAAGGKVYYWRADKWE